MIKALIEAGADFKERMNGDFGKTALSYAAEIYDQNMLEYLFKQVPTLNDLINDTYYLAPIFYAASAGNYEGMKFFLDKSKDYFVDSEWNKKTLISRSKDLGGKLDEKKIQGKVKCLQYLIDLGIAKTEDINFGDVWLSNSAYLSAFR